jgi:hypothetical protein
VTNGDLIRLAEQEGFELLITTDTNLRVQQNLQGRSLSFVTKVQFNGNLMVGKAYTAQLGLQPGDEFEIKLGRKQIKLIPLGAAEEE